MKKLKSKLKYYYKLYKKYSSSLAFKILIAFFSIMPVIIYLISKFSKKQNQENIDFSDQYVEALAEYKNKKEEINKIQDKYNEINQIEDEEERLNALIDLEESI